MIRSYVSSFFCLVALASLGAGLDFDPMKEPAEIKVDADKAKQWIANGAQPTDTVKALLKKSGAID